MDNHHVLNDPLAGMGGMNAGQREQYRQIGQQPQHSQQLHQQNYNDFAVDPSLIGDSWQQNPGPSYGHAGHQDVFSPPPQHQQPVYGQYGHSPQPQQFTYAQPQQQQQQQPIYPTQYASIYGQQSHSPAPQNAVHYDNNQFNGMPNNAQSIMNGDQNQSRAFQSFDRPAAAFPYPSANGNRGPTPQQIITPQQLDRDVQYLGQSRNTSTPQQQSNGDVNNLFDQNWISQPQPQYQQSTPVPQRSQPQQVLASNPQPANHIAAPSRPTTAHSTSVPASQPSSKPSSPAPPQQSSSTPRKKKSDDLGLRITHAEQLANAPPERRFENAPFLYSEEEMIWLPDKLADKALPKWSVKSNRSGRTLVEGLHERLASTGRAHKKLSSSKKYPSSVLTKTERLRTTSATGSATNSPRPSASSETESSEYTSDEEDSDYSSDDDEIMDLRTLEEVRPEPRPADIAEAAAWDAFTIMYSPAGRRPHPDERRTVGEKFPQLIGKLREDLIKVNADLATAEAAKAANVKDRKAEQKLREQALVKALRVAIDSPHQDLRDTLFSFDRFVAMVGNILRMVLKSKNSTGDIAMAVLELMSTYKFKGPSKEALEKIKWPQVAKAIKKTLDNKATDPVIAKKQEDAARFLQAIEDGQAEIKQPGRVGSFTAPNPAAKTDDAAPKADSIPSRPATAPSAYQGTAGLKRAREPDSSSSIPNKRTAPITSEPPKTGPKAAITLGAPVKSAASSSFFSKLGKPAPKPAAPPAAATPKPVIKKQALPQAPKPSILGSLLDSINAPKSEPKKVEAIKRAPETPEEKAKRERKESRRHLRVKFKEEGELEEIRLFSHDKAEDEGRDVDMLRDAHDDRSEGMMLKHNRIDADAVDEDDDTTMVDAQEPDINDKEYPQLSEIDFSELSEEQRKKNVIHRGGHAEITSPQSKIQADREATELMVVYIDESNIPDSAKEPSTLFPTENKQPARFADVKNQVIKDRLHDIQFSGEDVAWANMMNKLDSDLIAKAQLKQGPESIKLIIDTINSNPNVDVRNFYVPTGMDKNAMANLYKVFASKQGLPFPATQAPLWMSQGMQQSWYEGLATEEKRKKDEQAEKERLNAEAEARKVFEARQQMTFQPPMSAPPMGQPPFMGAPPMGAPPMAPPMGGHYPGMPGGPPPDPAQFAALMASMGLPNPTPPPAMPQWGQPLSISNPFPPPQAQNYNDNGNLNPYPGNYSNNNYGQNDYQQQGGHSNDAYGNNRPRGGNTYGDESSDGGAQNYGGNHGGNRNQNQNHNQGQGQGKKKKWGKNKKRADPDAPPPLEQYGAGGDHGGRQGRHDGAYKRKTIPCQFFQKGQCSKGDECTFIHEMEY